MATFHSNLQGNHLTATFHEGQNVLYVSQEPEFAGMPHDPAIPVRLDEFAGLTAWVLRQLRERGISCELLLAPLLDVIREALDAKPKREKEQ